jgi:hypothetical protein
MNAANNLEEFSGLNINQMETVGSTDAVNIVVQVKKFANRYDPNFTDWNDTATRRFLIQKDGDKGRITSPVLLEKEGVDAGKAETLQEFIQWGIRSFPAERYCLVVWNHGAGWRSVKTPGATSRGVSYDDQTGNNINTIELPAAIDMGGGRKWDLLAWDSSLMQITEVAYEVRDKAALIVGSEESPPGEGYPYDHFLPRLTAKPDMTARALAFVIADDTLEAYGADSNVTQSVLDASKIEPVVAAVNSLGMALLTATPQYGSAIAGARDLSENYAYPQNSDLLDFVRLLQEPAIPGDASPRVPEGGVQSACAQVTTAVRAAVLKNVRGQLHPNSNGLAIFLPSPAGYRRTDVDQANGFGQRYSELAFAKAAPNWQAFLVNGPP